MRIACPEGRSSCASRFALLFTDQAVRRRLSLAWSRCGPQSALELLEMFTRGCCRPQRPFLAVALDHDAFAAPTALAVCL